MSAAIEAATRPADLSVRLAVGCWLVLTVAVCTRTLLEPERHTIFPILANSSAHWWQDQSLYATYKPLDYYRYSPAFAVVATPLALLGDRAGGIAWTLLNLGVYAASLWRFLRDVLPGTWTKQRASLFFILAALGGLRGFWNGQSNALMIGLLLLAAAALVREQWWRAALYLAIPVLVKVTPLCVALLLIAFWPRRLAGRFLLILLAGLLLPFLTKAPTAVIGYYAEWFHHLTGVTAEHWVRRDGWTLWLVVRHLLGGPLDDAAEAPWYRVLQLTAALGVFAWSQLLRWRGCDRQNLINVTLGLGAVWLMVFGPASEHATYVFLAPTLAWALVDRDAWPRGRFLIFTAGVLLLALGWGALARSAESALLLTALPVGALLLAVWLVNYSLRVSGRQTVASVGLRDETMASVLCRVSPTPGRAVL